MENEIDREFAGFRSCFRVCEELEDLKAEIPDHLSGRIDKLILQIEPHYFESKNAILRGGEIRVQITMPPPLSCQPCQVRFY